MNAGNWPSLTLPAALADAVRCVELAQWLDRGKSTDGFSPFHGTDGPSYVRYVNHASQVSPLAETDLAISFQRATCGVTIMQGTDAHGLAVPSHLELESGTMTAVLWWSDQNAHPNITQKSPVSRSWIVAIPQTDTVKLRPSTIWHVHRNYAADAPWLAEIDWPSQSRMFRASVLDALAAANSGLAADTSIEIPDRVTWRMHSPIHGYLSDPGAMQLFLAASQLAAALPLARDADPLSGLSASALRSRRAWLANDGDIARQARRVLSAGFTSLAREEASCPLGVESTIHVHDLA